MPRPSKSVVVHKPAPPPAPVRVQPPSLMQTMQEGLAFGVGSSVARTMVDRMFERSAARETCTAQYTAFDNCILAHEDVGMCLVDKDKLTACMQSLRKE